MIDPTLIRRAIDGHAEERWVWLWRITADISTVATSVLFLTNQHEPITFAGDVYDPYWIRHGAIKESRQGMLQQVDVAVSNVDRTAAYWASMGEGFMNMPARLFLTARDLLAQGAAAQYDFTIAHYTLTRQSLTFRMEVPNFWRRLSPRDSFQRDRCRFGYKTTGCGYTGSLPTCNKTIADCIAHGDDEVLSGLPRLHPMRFGAFPGIPRGLR